MAITISGDLASAGDELISGYNPCLINFVSSVSGGARAEIVIGFATFTTIITTLHITPDTGEVFNFDFNGIARDLLSYTNPFLEPDYTFPDISTVANALFVDKDIPSKILYEIYIYDDNNTLIDSIGTGTGNQIEYYFLKASTQIGNSPIMSSYSYSVEGSILSENQSVIVWQGFPIDVQFDMLDTTLQEVGYPPINLTGAIISKTLATDNYNRMLRLVLIDDNGNEFTNLSIESQLEINSGNPSTQIVFDYEYKEVSTPDCSKYFRYKNIKGGDSFFLFEDAFQTQVNRKNKSDIIRNFDSLETAKSRNVSLGNDNRDALVCHHLATTELENSLLQGLALSPVIELWLGGNKWQRVNLVSSPPKLNSKQEPTNYALTFDLGVKYNQSI